MDSEVSSGLDRSRTQGVDVNTVWLRWPTLKAREAEIETGTGPAKNKNAQGMETKGGI
jgi:hypothetical protein